MENPFKQKDLPEASERVDYGNKPLIPISNKIYVLEENIRDFEYTLGCSKKQISESNISGNIGAILRILNNHTELLTYIIKVLFEEINKNIYTFGEKIENENNIKTLENLLKDVRNELKEIKDKL